MVNSRNWFLSKKDGIQINSKVIYEELFPAINEKLDENLPVSRIVSWIRHEAEEAFFVRFGRKPTTGALNNSVGRWNEFIAISALCEIAVELYQNSNKCVAIFSIENSTIRVNHVNRISANFLNLFNEDEFSSGNALEAINGIKQRIFFPSPDFIVALIEDESLVPTIQRSLSQQSRDPSNLELYQLLKGKLRAREVKAVISLKTSNRPDRRYQPSFEAATIKAIGYATAQNWRYYMVVSELTPADRGLFEQAIAPHGIAVGLESKLVDGLFSYERKSELLPLVQAALEP